MVGLGGAMLYVVGKQIVYFGLREGLYDIGERLMNEAVFCVGQDS